MAIAVDPGRTGSADVAFSASALSGIGNAAAAGRNWPAPRSRIANAAPCRSVAQD
jgi:hypothetical protein